MNEVSPNADWPETWLSAHKYDCQEVFGKPTDWGYALAYRNRQKETIKLLTDALPPGSTVLDVAAAQGNFTLDLAERGYRVTWNDIRPDLIGYVQMKHQHGDVAFAPGNIFDLSFSEAFDGILLCEVIEHVAHPDEFLTHLARLLKPGGIIVMTTPNGTYFLNRLPRFSECPDPSAFESVQFQPDSSGHIFLLWPDEVRRLASEAGLVVESQTFFTTPLTNGHMKSHFLLKALPLSWVWAVESVARYLPGSLQERFMVQTAALFRKPENKKRIEPEYKHALPTYVVNGWQA